MRGILLVGILSAMSLNLFAQGLGNVDEIFKMYQNDLTGGAEDASRYFEGFLAPAVKGLGFGISGGWFNSAETHKPGGFDLTFTVTGAFVPDDDLSFDFSNPNTVDIISPPDNQLPTVMGDATAPSFELKGSGGLAQFEALPGLGLKDAIGYNIVPTPMVQAGIGLPKGTELKVRFIPEVNRSDFAIKMYGFGVMHNVKQWIPGIKLMPFDLSAFVGYNHMELSNSFETAIARNGQLAFGFNSFTFQGIVSKSMSILTVYAAAGVATTSMNLKVNGEFDINDDTTIYELTDPIDLDITTAGPKVSAGFRLKLAVITIHADYTLQKYNALTVGFGVSIK